jgi:hypothetical protein
MMTVVDDILVIEEKGIYSLKILNVKTFDVLAEPIYIKQV